MSHLACADEPDNPMNERQRERFNAMRALLPPAPASLSNSGGTFLGPAYHFDVVRPGIALYGGRAHEDKPNPMRTVVRLTAKILQVHRGGPRRDHRLRRHLQGAAALAHRHHRLRLRRRLPARLERRHRRGRPRRLHRRLSGADRGPRVDGLHHRRCHRRARGADPARRLGGGDGPARHRRRPHRPGGHHRLRAAVAAGPARAIASTRGA